MAQIEINKNNNIFGKKTCVSIKILKNKNYQEFCKFS